MPEAVGLTSKIMDKYEMEILSLTLIPGENSVFDVVVNGKTIFSKDKAGRFPKFEEIDAALS